MSIEYGHDKISISRQCQLLGLVRSSLYYQSNRDDRYNEQLMKLLDKQYTKTPFYGVPRMTESLRQAGHGVNPKRIRRLMHKMGLQAIYPRKKLNLSNPNKQHKIYPYLLKGLEINRPDQVWATDITYIRMHKGWLYLVAVMDWSSRNVIAWDVSPTLDASFCVDTLKQALATGRKPEIFNTDQGSQFTSHAFTKVLLDHGIEISMDGKGRAFDNIMVERLWRSVKYEEVYLKDYQTIAEAVLGLRRYFEFYNNERIHQSLNYCTPASVYEMMDIKTPVAAAIPVALRAPSMAAATETNPPKNSHIIV
jgi:putative transposase